jgi:hypothetical protein
LTAFFFTVALPAFFFTAELAALALAVLQAAFHCTALIAAPAFFALSGHRVAILRAGCALAEAAASSTGSFRSCSGSLAFPAAHSLVLAAHVLAAFIPLLVGHDYSPLHNAPRIHKNRQAID